MNKKKAAYASGWMGRKKDRWNSMKLWSGNDLCRLDWILSFLILAVLFVTCAHSDVKLTGNRSFLMYEHFADFIRQAMSSQEDTGQIICQVRLLPMRSGICPFILQDTHRKQC